MAWDRNQKPGSRRAETGIGVSENSWITSSGQRGDGRPAMKRIPLVVLFVGFAVSLALAGLAEAGARSVTTRQGFGNHNLKGLYEFRADGVVESDGVPTRGFWEVGMFEADGQGNITNGKEYSSMLSSSDENVIDRPFTFEGTYTVHPDGIATGQVTVVVAPGVEIEKKLWLIIHSVGKDQIAMGFDGGHADAHLGDGVHGNALTHVGHRIVIDK